MECVSLWISAFIVATFAVDSKFRWPTEPLVCNKHCLAVLKENRQQSLAADQVDHVGCLNWSDPTIVATHTQYGQLYHQAFERGSTSLIWLLRKKTECVELDELSDGGRTYCLRRGNDNEPVEVAQCGRSDNSSAVITDHRISCRPPNDPMTWYRGEHSATISGKRCLRWDSPILAKLQVAVFAGWDFDRFDNPGRDTPPTRRVGASAHENYCRNPDNSTSGPWCYTLPTTLTNTIQEPCFNVCVEYRASEFCLSKNLFPWYLHWRDYKPEREDEQLKEIRPRRERPKVTGRPSSDDAHYQYYLNELLSTPKLTQFDANNEPMTTPFLAMDFLLLKSEYERVTRLTCFQTTEITAIAGPWIYTSAPDHHKRFAESYLFAGVKKASVWARGDKLGVDERYRLKFDEFSASTWFKFARDRRYKQSVIWDRRRRGIGLWRPCFLACQDVSVQCFPDEQFRYYGPRNRSLTGQSCLPYYILYEWIMDDDGRFRYANEEHTSRQMINFLRNLFLSDFIDAVKTTVIANGFAKGHGNRLATNRCLNLAGLLDLREENLARLEDDFWVEQLRAIRVAGPGCFVDLNDYSFSEPTLDNVVFQPCFRKCNATDDLELPFSQDPCQMPAFSNSCLKIDQLSMMNSTTTMTASTTTAPPTTTASAELRRLPNSSSIVFEWNVMVWPGALLVTVVSVSAVGVLASCLWGIRRGSQELQATI